MSEEKKQVSNGAHEGGIKWAPSVRPTLWKRFRRTLAHAFVVLCLAGYTAAGGLVFRFLEHPHEVEADERVRENVNITRMYVQHAVWEFTRPFLAKDQLAKESSLRTDLESLLEAQMDELQAAVLEAADNGVDIAALEPKYKWEYGSSLFFAATVVTTIGYGNIAPVTTSGRLFCMVFALIGIPLTLIAIADMGKLFATFVQFTWKRLRKRLCPKKLSRVSGNGSDEGDGASAATTTLRVIGFILLLLLYISAGAGAFIFWEDWTFFESFYFCFITMTTIGLGDIVPEHQMFMLLCTVYILIGLALTSTCLELARSEYEKSWKRMVEASRRLQSLSGISLADTLRKLNDQIEAHGEIVDFSVLRDLKTAITATGMAPSSSSSASEHSSAATSPLLPPKTPSPRVYIIYESSV